MKFEPITTNHLWFVVHSQKKKPIICCKNIVDVASLKTKRSFFGFDNLYILRGFRKLVIVFFSYQKIPKLINQ